MTTLNELENKSREDRTPLENCIIDAMLLEDERDGDYTLMEQAIAELDDLRARANDIEKGKE
jgi:hypothetical protein